MERVTDKRTGKTVILPTPEEDAAITAAAAEDPDNPELTEEDFAKMRPAWDDPELVEFLQKAGALGPRPVTEGDGK